MRRDSKEKVSRASKCPNELDLPDTDTSVAVSSGVPRFFPPNFVHAAGPLR
jgi:hypothetical protein